MISLPRETIAIMKGMENDGARCGSHPRMNHRSIGIRSAEPEGKTGARLITLPSDDFRLIGLKNEARIVDRFCRTCERILPVNGIDDFQPIPSFVSDDNHTCLTRFCLDKNMTSALMTAEPPTLPIFQSNRDDAIPHPVQLTEMAHRVILRANHVFHSHRISVIEPRGEEWSVGIMPLKRTSERPNLRQHHTGRTLIMLTARDDEEREQDEGRVQKPMKHPLSTVNDSPSLR